MDIFDWYRVAEIHRATYIALLNGALAVPGAKQQLAQALGISERYIRYLRDLFDVRSPNAALLQRLIAALPIDDEQRLDIVGHIELAREANHRITQTRRVVLTDAEVSEALHQLNLAHHIANTTPDPLQARAVYTATVYRGVALIQVIDAYRYPLVFVQACLRLYETQSVRNHRGDALYYAKLACEFIENLDRAEYRSVQDQLDSYWCRTLIAQAVAYNNLELPKLAITAYANVSAFIAHDDRLYAEWKPHLCRDVIGASIKQPRFSIRDLEQLDREARAICERRGAATDWVILCMQARALGRAYLRAGNSQKAHWAIRPYLDSIASTPYAGPLHKSIYLKTAAAISRAQGDLVSWHAHMRGALSIARDAKLVHQIQETKRVYGAELTPILEELGLAGDRV